MRDGMFITAGETITLKLDSAKRVAQKLSQHEVAALRQGARHEDGVIRPNKMSNFDKPEKRMAKLVTLGLATANAHGDWYITQAGRDALAYV